MRTKFRWLGLSMLLAVGGIAAESRAANATYYVSPSGSDSNDGSLDHPFLTVGKANTTIAGTGNTIVLRGGTYNLSSTLTLSKSGAAGSLNNLVAYQADPSTLPEVPILDFRSQPYSASNGGMKGISVSGSFWKVKGLTVQYAADNGVAVSGNSNTIEQVVARQNQDSGFIISGSNHPSNNMFLNCDSYGNYDFGAHGENADGFAIKFRGLGTGNVISGARAFDNADDGYDFWQAENGITVINSWAFHNGIASTFVGDSSFAGDGNGIKLGHDSGTHVIENMLVWGNPANGVDINGNATQLEANSVPAVIAHGVKIYNTTAVGNGGKNFNFDENPSTATPPTTHILRNNVSFTGSTTVNAGNTADYNTFNGPAGSPAGLGATAADFVSTVDPLTSNGLFHPAGTLGDRSGTTMPTYPSGLAAGPRGLDGSLPVLDFMRLATGSHLIDAGVDVGLPYNGTAPDLGYFETAPIAPPPLLGDYNGDHIVDTSDYTIWQDSYGQSESGLPADGDGSGTIDDGDFTVWLNQFGQSNGGGGLGGASGVPEPATWALGLSALFAVVRGAGWRRHKS